MVIHPGWRNTSQIGRPARLTIASEFAGTHVKVLVIESGGLDEDPDYDSLGEIESDGVPRVVDQTRVRNRIVGGTSHTWSGAARRSTRSTSNTASLPALSYPLFLCMIEVLSQKDGA